MKAVVAEFPPHWLAERKRFGSHRFDEMWDGVLHIPPVQTTTQQVLNAELAIYLHCQWARPCGNRANHGVNLTTPEDEAAWLKNYRVPDIVLLTPDRFHIDKNEYLAGAPLVVIEIRSPSDETYEKFPFYAALGVPEVWVFDRDTKVPEVHVLEAAAYQARAADTDSWLRSPATSVEFRQTRPGKVWLRINGDEATAMELPDS